MQAVDDLGNDSQVERFRYCRSCTKNVFNLDGLTEGQIEGVLLSSPNVCVHASFPHPHIEITGYEAQSKSIKPPLRPNRCPTPLDLTNEEDSLDLRVIETARSLVALNKATEEGYKALIKEASTTDSESWHTWLIKNKQNGEYIEVSDPRSFWSITRASFDFENDTRLLPEYLSSREDDDTNYFDYMRPPRSVPPKPWAAYLIPKDLVKGERVVLEDLIEYRPQTTMGDRRHTAIAIWTGNDFEIEEREPDWIIG